ncbi:hypothetical protein SPWS13_1383 [Shewanella putrefaciens]|nr:hypothetical protein SPWS13_1383 [Shewanella putrefaciens]
MTVVPILIQALAEKYLSDEVPWVNQPEPDSEDEEDQVIS